MSASGVALAATAFAGAGWALENVSSLFGEGRSEKRYSALWGGRKIPLLPVYAFGGLAVLATAPTLKEARVPWMGRAAIYGAMLSGIEYVGCRVDRDVLGACSWNYASSGTSSSKKCGRGEGCVDLKHALLWAALGLALESLTEPSLGYTHVP